jgi:hypothetical protein
VQGRRETPAGAQSNVKRAGETIASGRGRGEDEMLKSFARAAGFLAYLFITLEMLFMVTPFALYYYSVYSPLLVGSFSLPATGWLPAFFLPHLSAKILHDYLLDKFCSTCYADLALIENPHD